jgi:hypothetical protein
MDSADDLHDSTKAVIPYAQQNDSNVVGYSYLQTVAENKKLFTERQIESADKSRQLYRMLGRPGLDRFMDMVRNNFIINCPVTIDDVTCAQRCRFPQRQNNSQPSEGLHAQTTAH